VRNNRAAAQRAVKQGQTKRPTGDGKTMAWWRHLVETAEGSGELEPIQGCMSAECHAR